MFRKRNKSIFEHAQETSVVEFSKRYKNEEITVNNPMDKNGAILVPLDMEDEVTKSLLVDYRYTLSEPKSITENDDGSEQVLAKSASALIRNVTANMVEIPTYMPFKDAINTIYNIYKELGEDFYGAFMVNKKKQKFNPLHPITALELMDDVVWTKDSYKIYVYSYDKREEKELEITLKQEYCRVSDKTLIEKNIASQIAIYYQKHTMIQKVSSDTDSTLLIRTFREGLEPTFRVTNQMSMSAGSKSRLSAFLIPHNILNNGITIPYYGSSIVNMTNRVGYQCSPMLSANIGFNFIEFLTKNTYVTHSICTGGLSSSTLTGIKSLNHANLTSPLNRRLLQPGWRDYVDRCIDYSFMAYESILEGYNQEFDDTFLEPKFETYMEEYFYINKEASMVDYLKHVAMKAKGEIKDDNKVPTVSEPEEPGMNASTPL